MKHLITLLLLSTISMSLVAQKVAKVTVTTTESLATGLQKCIDAGKEAKYGSKDLDSKAGTVTLWQSVPSMSGNMYEFQILVSSEVKDSKTAFTFRMPHVPGVMSSFTKALKKYVAKLKLPDMVVGEYSDGIE